LLVVSDTTAITSLSKIGRAEILSRLFRQIVIPNAVRDELLKYHPSLPAFLEVKALQDTGQLVPLLRDLEAGEAEAILLALELRADALLIDDRRGRRIAEERGVRCMGLAGALLLAKKRGIVPLVREILDELEKGARFYLKAEIKVRVLESAGE